MTRRRGSHLRWLSAVAVVCVASGTGCALVAEEYERLPSPDGDRTLIIRMYSDWIDPMYPLRLRDGWRITNLGCLNGDHSGINSVEWLDDTTLRLNLDGGATGDIPVTVHVDGDVTVDGDPNDLLHSC